MASCLLISHQLWTLFNPACLRMNSVNYCGVDSSCFDWILSNRRRWGWMRAGQVSSVHLLLPPWAVIYSIINSYPVQIAVRASLQYAIANILSNILLITRLWVNTNYVFIPRDARRGHWLVCGGIWKLSCPWTTESYGNAIKKWEGMTKWACEMESVVYGVRRGFLCDSHSQRSWLVQAAYTREVHACAVSWGRVRICHYIVLRNTCVTADVQISCSIWRGFKLASVHVIPAAVICLLSLVCVCLLPPPPQHHQLALLLLMFPIGG